MTTTLSPEKKAEANSLLKLIADSTELFNLKARWLDEREYEDFADYRKLIVRFFELHGYCVTAVNKAFTADVTRNGVKLRAKIGTRRIQVLVLR